MGKSNSQNSNGTQPDDRRKKLAIIGFAPSSLQLAPMKDQGYEIWGVNEIYKVVPRIDRLFEIHHYRHLTEKQRNPGHLTWLQKATIPIYMVDHFADIPASQPFPRAEVKAHFAKHNLSIRTSYWTNTISWMLGMAIMEGYTEIGLWGVDMAQDTEYRHQRPSVEYWIGVGQGMGVNIFVPPECDILQTAFEYGFEEEGHHLFAQKLNGRRAELQRGLNQMQNEIAVLNDRMQATNGQLQEIAVIQGRYMPVTGWTAEAPPPVPQQPDATKPSKPEEVSVGG